MFAFGLLYYLINYGFEVYGDRCLAEDPYEHGPKVVELLQSIEFPALGGNPLIDEIIDKCWHNKYATVSQLAIQTQMLLSGRINAANINGGREGRSGDGAAIFRSRFMEGWCVFTNRIVHAVYYDMGKLWMSLLRHIKGWLARSKQNDTNHGIAEQGAFDEEFISKKKICEDLQEQGLLHYLSLGEPEQIGFTFDWYRHSLPN